MPVRTMTFVIFASSCWETFINFLPYSTNPCLYYDKDDLTDPLEVIGRDAYKFFRYTLRLTTVVRQQGDDQRPFRDALEHVRTMSCTHDDWTLLSSRCRLRLSHEDVRRFDDAVRVYYTNAEVDDFNYRRMSSLACPVIQIKAKGEGSGWDDASSRDAGNLELYFPVCIGARVISKPSPLS
ncbi:hypothetical protein GGR54DRAFT_308231 [Hypoxylon sp. NC1633]|nr:hypothetical protein GGR54DRAFT_308231 [Hypoxylon sp. NC1633]